MTDTRAEFEAAYIAHLKQQWPLNKCTPQDLAVMREGDGYGDGASHLTGAWWGWRAASVLGGEVVAWRYLTPTGWHATTDLDRALGASAHHDMEPLYAHPAPSAPAQPAVPEGSAAAFIRDVAAQTPEQPDYWSSCGQCGHNIERAQDLLDAPAQSGGERTALSDALFYGVGFERRHADGSVEHIPVEQVIMQQSAAEQADAPQKLCSICHGYGRYQDGDSGTESDGYAPNIVECECAPEERFPRGAEQADEAVK